MSVTGPQPAGVHLHTIVCVLAGRARRVLQRGGAPRAVVQRRAAAAVPVPRGGEVPQLHVAEGTQLHM